MLIFDVPLRTFDTNHPDLSLNYLVSDFTHRWKVGCFPLKHHEHHSFPRWRHFGCAFLPIVETEPLKVCVTYKVNYTFAELAQHCWIVPFLCIGSQPDILFGSSNMNQIDLFLVFREGHEGQISKIDSSGDYLSLLKGMFVAQTVSLISYLELQAVRAVELAPLFNCILPILPGPVEFLHADNLFLQLLL